MLTVTTIEGASKTSRPFKTLASPFILGTERRRLVSAFSAQVIQSHKYTAVAQSLPHFRSPVQRCRPWNPSRPPPARYDPVLVRASEPEEDTGRTHLLLQVTKRGPTDTCSTVFHNRLDSPVNGRIGNSLATSPAFSPSSSSVWASTPSPISPLKLGPTKKP